MIDGNESSLSYRLPPEIRCTGYRGKCPDKYVREEEIARQIGEAVKAIQLDGEVLEWIKTALKGSHEAEERHHREALVSLQA